MTSLSSSSASPFCAAVIASAHGVHGHVKVKCFLEDPTRFKSYSPFSNEAGESVYTVKKVLSQNKDVLVVSLDGVNDRTMAEGMRGEKLMLSPDRLPSLVEDTYYHKDLIGLSVVGTNSQPLGTVNALYNFGAGDLLEVKLVHPSTSVPSEPTLRTNGSSDPFILSVAVQQRSRRVSGELVMVPFTHDMVPEINLETGTLRLSKDGEAFLDGGSDDA